MCPEIIKFGKYSGFHIDEICVKDFKYLLWLVQNANQLVAEKIKLLPKYIEHEIKNKIEIANKINNYKLISSGDNTITFNSNPNYLLKESYDYIEELKDYYDYYFATSVIEDNNIIYILFKDVKCVSGMYPYNMGYIKGKPKKIKNKSFKLTLKVIYQYKNAQKCLQFVIVE